MEELLHDFPNWVTKEEEANAYGEILFKQNFSELPQDMSLSSGRRFGLMNFEV